MMTKFMDKEIEINFKTNKLGNYSFIIFMILFIISPDLRILSQIHKPIYIL